MTITALPELDRTSPTFKTEVETFFATDLPAFSVQAEAARVEINANTATASAAATTATTQAAAASASATSAATSATSAAASALTALNAPGTSATSSTSETFGGGSKSLMIQTGKSIVAGMHVIAAKSSDPAKHMRGTVTSYDSGTGVLEFTSDNKFTGVGSNNDWMVSLSGIPGADGASGLDYLASAGALTAGMQYCLDSSVASFTATMPPSPSVGDLVSVSDPFLSWATNPVTLDRNGSNFVDQYGVAQAEDFELNVAGVSVTFIYRASGWRAI